MKRILPLRILKSSDNFIKNCISLASCWDFNSYCESVQEQFVQVQAGKGSNSSHWSQIFLILVKKVETSSFSCLISLKDCCKSYKFVPEEAPNHSSKFCQISLAELKYKTLLAILVSRTPNNQEINILLHMYRALYILEEGSGFWILPSTKPSLFFANKLIISDLSN